MAEPTGQTRLGVAALGDPASPSTWSGTPRRVIEALRTEGLSVAPLGVETGERGQRLRMAGYLLHHAASSLLQVPPRLDVPSGPGLVRGRYDYVRTRSARKRQAATVHELAERAGVDAVLHMGSLTLPVDADPARRHYVLVDATWHTATAYLNGGSNRLLGAIAREERAAYSRVSHFFPLSDYVAEDLRHHYGVDPARITVVGTGLGQLEPFQGDKPYSELGVLFSARVRAEEKGLPLLVEAFRRAAPDLEGARLTVVGDPRYPELFRDDRDIVGLGHVERADLERLFHEAALFAMPALLEPWGLVYLEALASRTPILGLRRNAFPELAGNGKFGFIVDEATPEAVADALREALSDPARLAAMGAAGQAHCAEHFSWERVGRLIASEVA